jgi:hypothetical protein
MGIFWQHLYLNSEEELVVVVLSACPKPTGSRMVDGVAFFATVAKVLRQ